MKNIIVVGVGALGSHTVLFLRNVEATLKVIDHDRVESKNILSQFHGKAGVGKSKVQSLHQSMLFFFGTKIEVNQNKLVPGNVWALLEGASLIIDCLDNGAGRRIIQTFARANRIPCLHGALAADGQFGRVIWDEHFVIDDETQGGAATCEDGEHLPFIAITSSYLAHAARAFLSDGTKVGFSINPAGAIRI